MNIITNHVKGVQAGFKYPINQEVTKNADGSGGTIYKQTKKKSWYDSFSDWGHGILDVAGMVPAFGNIADGVNAAWYLAEGDTKNAGLSALAATPGLGLFSGGTKLSLKAADAMKDINKAKKISKHTDPSAINLANKLYEKGGYKLVKAVPEVAMDNIRSVPTNIKKNFREGSKWKIWGNRPVALTKGENVLEYGNAAYQIGEGIYEGAKGGDNTVQPGSYKKQRYIGGVAPSGRQSLKSFKKFTNNTVYHGFNDRKDPVRKK